MKKSEPKMILNVSFDNNELEEKVKIATDKYVEQLVLKDLDNTIAKIVEKRIDRLIHGCSWNSDRKIQGIPLETFVRERTENVLAEFIDKNIKKILNKKITELIISNK